MDVQRQVSELVKEAETKAATRSEARGEARGKIQMLELLMETKFGPAPRWAKERIQKARVAQVERWTKKILVADTLEGVIGKR